MPTIGRSCLNRDILALYYNDRDAAKKALKEALLKGTESVEGAAQ